MNLVLQKFIDGNKKRVNRLLEEAYYLYKEVPNQDLITARLSYKKHLNKTSQGAELLQILKQISEMINETTKPRFIVCDNFSDYSVKIKEINTYVTFPFYHDWEESWNDPDGPILIQIAENHVEIMDLSEMYDLANIEIFLTEQDL